MAEMTYSGDLVRAHDYDRFLSSLFTPADRRPALWALYAFNYEIARTREVVSNTMLGLIRLQWWHDAFGRIYGGGEIPAHEILRDLAPAIRTHGLAREDFEQMLYAREFDLEDRPPENLQGLEHYVDFTATPLLRMAQAIAGETAGDGAPVAKAYAMAGLLRAVPFHAAQRRCYLPGINVEGLYAGKPQGLEDAARGVAERLETLLNEARLKGKTAKVMAAQTGLFLKVLKNNNFNVLGGRISAPIPFYALRVWAQSLG